MLSASGTLPSCLIPSTFLSVHHPRDEKREAGQSRSPGQPGSACCPAGLSWRKCLFDGGQCWDPTRPCLLGLNGWLAVLIQYLSGQTPSMKEVFQDPVLAPGFQDQKWAGRRPLLLFIPFSPYQQPGHQQWIPKRQVSPIPHFGRLSCLGGKYPELIVESLPAAGEIPVPLFWCSALKKSDGTDEVRWLSGDLLLSQPRGLRGRTLASLRLWHISPLPPGKSVAGC